MTNGSDQAYPLEGCAAHATEFGLSNRELFAAMAMQGHCANSTMFHLTSEKMAELSVEQADALITALK